MRAITPIDTGKLTYGGYITARTKPHWAAVTPGYAVTQGFEHWDIEPAPSRIGLCRTLFTDMVCIILVRILRHFVCILVPRLVLCRFADYNCPSMPSLPSYTTTTSRDLQTNIPTIVMLTYIMAKSALYLLTYATDMVLKLVI